MAKKKLAKVEIYTTRICPYCFSAKQLLNKKDMSFTEIDVSDNPRLRDAMTARAQGWASVPQIFINDSHIGGCDALYALEAGGQLDTMLEC